MTRPCSTATLSLSTAVVTAHRRRLAGAAPLRDRLRPPGRAVAGSRATRPREHARYMVPGRLRDRGARHLHRVGQREGTATASRSPGRSPSPSPRRALTLAYSGDTLSSGSVLLRANITDAADGAPGDLANATVTFKEGAATLCGPLGRDGWASALCRVTLAPGSHKDRRRGRRVLHRRDELGTVAPTSTARRHEDLGRGGLIVASSSGTYKADARSRLAFAFDVRAGPRTAGTAPRSRGWPRSRTSYGKVLHISADRFQLLGASADGSRAEFRASADIREPLVVVLAPDRRYGTSRCTSLVTESAQAEEGHGRHLGLRREHAAVLAARAGDRRRFDLDQVMDSSRARQYAGRMRRRLTPVDRVGVDERAAVLGKRSIKAESQQERSSSPSRWST